MEMTLELAMVECEYLCFTNKPWLAFMSRDPLPGGGQHPSDWPPVEQWRNAKPPTKHSLRPDQPGLVDRGTAIARDDPGCSPNRWPPPKKWRWNDSTLT